MRSSILTQKRAKTLRRAMTQPEKLLWAILRDNAIGLHFRRQHAVGPFILDFYRASAKLCVEIDGPVHAEQQEYDARRTRWLNDQGIRVIRISTGELQQRPEVAIENIKRAAAPTTA